MTRPSTLPVYTNDAAKAAHCWFNVDRVSGDPAATAWKRLARWGQAQWRESRGYAAGSEPYRGGPDATPVGSRLDLAFARTSGANFVTPGALTAVRARLAAPERFQMLKEERLFGDLLSSMPLCFNLFGDLAGDREGAKRAVRAWWPDAPSGAVRVRFEHSPGRRDPLFLGNQSAFDVAFDINAGAGARAIVGVETKYHEHAAAEAAPKPAALARYLEVTAATKSVLQARRRAPSLSPGPLWGGDWEGARRPFSLDPILNSGEGVAVYERLTPPAGQLGKRNRTGMSCAPRPLAT